METSSNTNVSRTSLPLGPMQVDSMLGLTSSGFLVFSVVVMYSIISCFHNFQCSLMFPLKLNSCGRLNLSDWLLLLNLNFYFWHHVKIFSGLSKRTFSLRAIVECSLMQQWYNNYPRQFTQMIDYGQWIMAKWHCDILQTRQLTQKIKNTDTHIKLITQHLNNHIAKMPLNKWEREERKLYSRILQIEHVTFTPLVFSTYRSIGREYTEFYSEFAELLSDKRKQSKSLKVNSLRTKACFHSLKSCLLCLKGSSSIINGR